MLKRTLMLFFLLTLILGACGQGDAQDGASSDEVNVDATVEAAMSETEAAEAAAATNTPPPEDTPPPPTDTPEPAPSPTMDTGEMQAINLDETAVAFSPQERNFATELIFRLTIDEEVVSELMIDGVSNMDGSSTLTYDFSNVDVMPMAAATTLIEKDDTTYISLPDGTCVSTGMGEPPVAEMALNTGTIVLETEEMLAGQLAWNGEAEVNGVATDEYLIDADNFVDQTGITNMTSGVLNVSQEGNYVVRLILEGSGESELLAPGVTGDLYYELNLIPQETPFEITVPDNCIDAGDIDVGVGDGDDDAGTGDGDAGEDTGDEAPAEFVISQVSQTVTHTCQGEDVVVEGASNTITLTGNCNQLVVNSAGNTINVASAAEIVINGGGNTINYGGSPSITDNGLGNSLNQQ